MSKCLVRLPSLHGQEFVGILTGIFQTNKLQDTRTECRRRISAAYGESNTEDEIFKRLEGRHTQAQDAERVRLRARHGEHKEWLSDSARTIDELENFAPYLDSNWVTPED